MPLSRRKALELLLLAGGASSFGFSQGSASPFGTSPFRLRAKADSYNILVYGDAGSGEDSQIAVGEAMAREHLISPFDFAVSVGDNQYINSLTDTYEKIFERPYARLIQTGVPFFQTLGNHDWEFGRAPDQLEYSAKVDAVQKGKGGFVLPSQNHVIRKPGLKWIIASTTDAFGTVNISKETMTFLETELSENFDGWKILTTHLPFFSTGPRGDNSRLQEKLFPLLKKYPVDMYFAGHEHDAELMKPWSWMTHAVVGNGREYRPGRAKSLQPSLFFMDQIGFVKLRIEGNTAKMQFINDRNQILYSTDIQRRPSVWGDVQQQQDNTVVARLRTLRRDSVESVKAQFGFSDSPSSPIFEPSKWSFKDMNYLGTESDTGLYLFEKNLNRRNINQWGVARFQVPSQAGRWIYADLGMGIGSGNYDGVSEFLKIEPF